MPPFVAVPPDSPHPTDERHGAIARVLRRGSTYARQTVLAALNAYKLLISPLFAGSCRFVPSCSDYAREAVDRHGVFRGTWFAARRLSRCHPFGGSGHDPVPRADD